MPKIKKPKKKKEFPDHIYKHMEQIPSSMQSAYLTALRGRSMKASIKAFCQECTGWLKNEIKDCPSKRCPLHPHRPYRPDNEPKDRRILFRKERNE